MFRGRVPSAGERYIGPMAFVRPAEQFAYFREEIVSRFGIGEVQPIRRAADAFSSAVKISMVRELMFIDITADALQLSRTQRDIQRWDRPWYSIGLTLAGTSRLQQNGHRTRLQRDDLVLCDSTKPFHCTYESPFRQLLVLMDHSSLARRLASAAALSGTRPPPSAVSAITAQFLTSLAVQSQTQSLGGAEELLAAQALDLVVMSLGGGLDGSPSAAQTQRTRIKAFIETQLCDPQLGPDTIARHHGFSRRTLYSLFESEPLSVSEWIRRRRLERCRDLLLDPSQRHRTITDLAFSLGLGDASHFSRDFRRAFGQSPRELRQGRQIFENGASLTEARTPARDDAGSAQHAVPVAK